MHAARQWERFLSCTTLPEATKVVAMNDYLNQACSLEPVESMQAALATCQVSPDARVTFCTRCTESIALAASTGQLQACHQLPQAVHIAAQPHQLAAMQPLVV